MKGSAQVGDSQQHILSEEGELVMESCVGDTPASEIQIATDSSQQSSANCFLSDWFPPVVAREEGSCINVDGPRFYHSPSQMELSEPTFELEMTSLEEGHEEEKEESSSILTKTSGDSTSTSTVEVSSGGNGGGQSEVQGRTKKFSCRQPCRDEKVCILEKSVSILSSRSSYTYFANRFCMLGKTFVRRLRQ
tara:strand:- start:345 stop:920 length:576 start_codon:yes stop_codon:yes gene_type:complete